jgi:hypothetical protein
MREEKELDAGKEMTLRHAQAMAEARYVELMAAAGVSERRIALEVLYMLPRQLVEVYGEVFEQAFGGKDDGGTGARGRAEEESARVGVAGAPASEQGRVRSDQERMGRGARSGGGKRFKRHWIIADEAALEIKDRADKRLRALARDMAAEMAELVAEQSSRVGSGRRAPSAPLTRFRRCEGQGCGLIMAPLWKWCAHCGHQVAAQVEGVER